MNYFLKLLERRNLWEIIETNLIKIVVSLLVFLILKSSKKYFDRMIRAVFARGKMEASVSSFLLSLFSVFYYAFIFYLLIGFFGVNMSSVAAFLGVSGLFFGLVFKETLANFSGGIIILTFKPFKIGDLIEFKDYVGDVKSIELFYTTLKNAQNELIIVPNGIITNNELRNMTAEEIRRQDIQVGVAYNSDVVKVKSVLLSIVDSLKEANKYEKDGVYILDEPRETVGIAELGENSVIFNINVYVKKENYVKIKYLLNEKIKLRFEEEGIEIPFPQMDVHLKNIDNNR